MGYGDHAIANGANIVLRRRRIALRLLHISRDERLVPGRQAVVALVRRLARTLMRTLVRACLPLSARMGTLTRNRRCAAVSARGRISALRGGYAAEQQHRDRK